MHDGFDVVFFDMRVRRHWCGAPNAGTAGFYFFHQIGLGIFIAAVFRRDFLVAWSDDFFVDSVAGHAAAGLREFFIGCGVAGSEHAEGGQCDDCKSHDYSLKGGS